MPEIKYKGNADEVRFLKGDFTRHGVEDQDAVHFDVKNGHKAEVSDAAFAMLSEQGFPFVELDAEGNEVSAAKASAEEPADTPKARKSAGPR